jgi:hypothetical protein
MIIKCCNPECDAPLDYREGRLVRFSRNPAKGKLVENHTLIRHFWLCGKCAGLYVFEYESETIVRIKLRHQELPEEKLPHFVSAA